MTYKQCMHLVYLVLGTIAAYTWCRWHFWGVGSKWNTLDDIVGVMAAMILSTVCYYFLASAPRSARETSSVSDTVGSPTADRVAD